MFTPTLPTRLLIAAGAIAFAAAAAAQQPAHTVTCADGTTDNSTAKSPCHGHGGIKPAPGAVAVNAPPARGSVAVNAPPGTSSSSASAPPAKPKSSPKPAPAAPAASAAIIGPLDSKIASPRDPASPTKVYNPAAGGIGNTAEQKEGQMNKAAGGVGNTAVQKEGQMNKAAGGVGTTEVVKMNSATPGGVGQTQVMKEDAAVKCKDGTYSAKTAHAKDQCVNHGGVSITGGTKTTPP